DRRQPSAVDAARVDPDLVWEVHQYAPLRRVPEDDRVRERVTAPDELLADPEEGLGVLLLERAIGPDSRMDEEEAARGERLHEALEEREVLRREAVGRPRAGRLWRDAVAPQRRGAAIAAPGLAPLPAALEVREAHRLVVALEENRRHVV